MMTLQISDQRLISRIRRVARYQRRSPEEVVAAALDVYDAEPKKTSGVDFLLAIAGQAASGESDVSMRDEEILTAAVDPIKGWQVDDQ